ncbi:hypothetical protein [Daejeonella sp.]|uniref:hypothetical protein n=1 Tax=Daejeonella sp. TaxID=2805397 RepID=UPI00271BD6FE|nr:hypothetical protein [Daejeonella sp.]MDO8993421.1 hypothetical protein [Daejeonella sp.]MDP2414396.1 hypothetical protein [Daejeonella sp.]
MKDSQIYKSKIVPESRANWEKSFKVMHERGDDELLIRDLFEDEDFEKWTFDTQSNESNKPWAP